MVIRAECEINRRWYVPMLFVAVSTIAALGQLAHAEETLPGIEVFAKENLVAWCIVPFDSKKRGPSERAQMLVRLGIKKLAYDWRDEHVPYFRFEIGDMLVTPVIG